MLKRTKIAIRGAVQGVGFRPFVYRLASELNLNGWVINSSQGVFIDAEGEENSISSFVARLKTDRPKLSHIQSFEHSYLDTFGYKQFEIKESTEIGAKTALVLPDIALCDDCKEEIFHPGNRRYLYPFTNCTNCGPRFSIIRTLPYDRINTAMDEFEMCDDCRGEYTNPSNRRFHAEPIACPNCGPHVWITGADKKVIAEFNDAITKAAEYILGGKIIALKGIGGFQLLADATSKEAVDTLRLRKHRSEKPFALMFPDLSSVEKECIVSPEEKELLESSEAPIVLLKKRKDISSKIAAEVTYNNPYLGVMLPYSPLHHILMKYLGIPVIATSGNISEEPICITEEEAYEKLGNIADHFLVHNRKILRHVDDSIVRIAAGREYMIRRARGYAPLPLVIKIASEPVLAVGPHLKNTIALNKGSNVFISQHIGDLENTESINAFERVINDFETFYELEPKTVVSDMHPDYISTKFAVNSGLKHITVQHHYAHMLSCMAENEITGPVLGVSWDGTGYGTDGVIWGSEFMISDSANFKRFAHLKPFMLPGGEKAIKENWRIAFSMLWEMFGKNLFDENNKGLISNFPNANLEVLAKMLKSKINSPLTTSMGRFFDAVSALLGIRHTSTFEAQAAMELEFAADDLAVNDYLDFGISSATPHVIEWDKILMDIISEIECGTSVDVISAKFHNTLAEIILQIAGLAKQEKVVLTGGCFMNKYLMEKTIKRLKEEKFKVYWHQRVPAGDGGISLGQINYAVLKENA